MTLDLSAPDHARAFAALSPYLRHCVTAAGELAHRIHADEVGLEHLLLVLMADEECGAHAVVLHAFADPETLFAEILAITPGMLVVGSGRSLPFSTRAIDALFAARAAARRAAEASPGPASVTPEDVLHAAAARLPDELLSQLQAAGYRSPGASPSGAGGPAPGDDPLFKCFDQASKRLLGQACRAAVGRQRAAIAPAHLVLAALEVDPALAAATGLSGSRARMVLHDRDVDETPLRERELALDTRLGGFLARLAPGAGTPDVLRASVLYGSVEIQLLLAQQRITEALLDSVGAAFRDPVAPTGA